MTGTAQIRSLIFVCGFFGLSACGSPSTETKNLRHSKPVAAQTGDKAVGAGQNDDTVYLVNENDVATKISQAMANPKEVADQVMAVAAAESGAPAKDATQSTTETGQLTVKVEAGAPAATSEPTAEPKKDIAATAKEKPEFDTQDKVYRQIHDEFTEKLKKHPGSMTAADVDYLSQQLAGFVHHGSNKQNKDAAEYWNKFSTRVHELAKARAEKKLGFLPILFGLGALVAGLLAPAVAIVAAVAAPLVVAPLVAVNAVHNIIEHVFRVVG